MDFFLDSFCGLSRERLKFDPLEPAWNDAVAQVLRLSHEMLGFSCDHVDGAEGRLRVAYDVKLKIIFCSEQMFSFEKDPKFNPKKDDNFTPVL